MIYHLSRTLISRIALPHVQQTSTHTLAEPPTLGSVLNELIGWKEEVGIVSEASIQQMIILLDLIGNVLNHLGELGVSISNKRLLSSSLHSLEHSPSCDRRLKRRAHTALIALDGISDTPLVVVEKTELESLERQIRRLTEETKKHGEMEANSEEKIKCLQNEVKTLKRKLSSQKPKTIAKDTPSQPNQKQDLLEVPIYAHFTLHLNPETTVLQVRQALVPHLDYLVHRMTVLPADDELDDQMTMSAISSSTDGGLFYLFVADCGTCPDTIPLDIRTQGKQEFTLHMQPTQTVGDLVNAIALREPGTSDAVILDFKGRTFNSRRATLAECGIVAKSKLYYAYTITDKDARSLRNKNLEPFQLRINCACTKDYYSLDVHPGQTILHVKQILVHHAKVPVERMRLMNGSKELDNSLSLSKIDFARNDLLILLINDPDNPPDDDSPDPILILSKIATTIDKDAPSRPTLTQEPFPLRIVCASTGDQFPLEVVRRNTVLQMKRSLVPKLNVPVQRMSLMNESEELDDTVTLSAINFGGNDSLILIINDSEKPPDVVPITIRDDRNRKFTMAVSLSQRVFEFKQAFSQITHEFPSNHSTTGLQMSMLCENGELHAPDDGDLQPFFLRTEPDDITTLDQLATLFRSLICHLEGGNSFTEMVSTRACVLLKRIVPLCREMDADPDIHFKHIHSPQSSFNRLIKSIVSLLRCSNEDLVQLTISCLCDILRRVSPSTLFDSIAAGLLSLLPHAFYQQDMHLVPHADSNLMVILYWLVCCSHPDNSRMICEKDEISTEAFQQIFMDKFIHPVEPFIEFICLNSRLIADSDDQSDFPRLLGTLVGHSPFLAQMTLSILSSSVPFAYTASLAVFESAELTSALLHPLLDGLLEWQAEGPAVHLRSKQILAKLREDGLSDEIKFWKDTLRGSDGCELQVDQIGGATQDQFNHFGDHRKHNHNRLYGDGSAKNESMMY
ncbi:hypothetical protein BLNAU_6019 [Blattamonas nauphoetae]|uniref:Ubiquitin-like domain-containing protein n=1 Tax=Blattamonas nauphoetae TaxID=2049346 RepID=A0ABQ9Y5M2_9EUKA|nr:hypothetical protein BLNAU_6019 [Blattamonas nauphoetae]